MLAVHVMALAREVGLTQAAISRQFGIDDSVVNCWAQGKKEVSHLHREDLVRLVFQATVEHIQSLPKPERSAFALRVAGVGLLARQENLQARGVEPNAETQTLIRALAQAVARASHAPEDAQLQREVQVRAREVLIVAMADAQLALLLRGTLNKNHGGRQRYRAEDG